MCSVPNHGTPRKGVRDKSFFWGACGRAVDGAERDMRCLVALFPSDDLEIISVQVLETVEELVF